MNKEKKQKLLAIYAWGTLILGLLFISVIIGWLIYPYKLITFNKIPYPVPIKVVEQGGTLHYEVSYCKYTNKMPTSIKREFVDGIIFESNDVRANVTTGCKTLDVITEVPKTLPAGKYRLRLTITYKPNPLRTIEFVNESEEFIVRDAVNPARNLLIK